jgi:carbohydrate-selective porin OprB
MKWCHCLVVSLLATSALADDEPARAINYGGGIAFDLIHASHDHDWLVNLDAGAWIEADLGELAGADDWYLFMNPTLVWGAEEDWQWTPRLYQAWLMWDGSDYFNALFGIVDLSWHFHSLPSTSPFVRMPARAAGEFSPGSIGLLDLFPLSSPTVRIEWKPTTHLYLQTAASWLDDDHQIKGRELLLGQRASERLLFISELGYQDEGDEASGWRHRMAGVGGWWLPGADDSWGAYAFADAKLWSEHDERWQGLSGFVSASIAHAASSDQEHRIAAGLSYEGLLPMRDEDLTALALIYEHAGDELEHPTRSAFELLHRVKLNDHAWVQASIQCQSNLDDTGDGEWRAGLRIGWEF